MSENIYTDDFIMDKERQIEKPQDSIKYIVYFNGEISSNKYTGDKELCEKVCVENEKKEDNYLAKKIEYVNNDTCTYLLKANRYGFLYDNHSIALASKDRYIGEKEWRFEKVTKDVFDLYLRYLKSRNKAFIKLAQRQFQNK
jgi:hypothetical protein